MRAQAIRKAVVALATAAALVAIAAPAAAATEVATTEAATDLTRTGATLHGTVDAPVHGASYVFEYGTTTEYGSYTEVGVADAGVTQVSADLIGLEPGTTYHYRLWALYKGEGFVGEDLSLTTLDGIFITGEESAEESSQPRIEAPSYPEFLWGATEPGIAWSLFEKNGLSADCETALFSGGDIAAATQEVALELLALSNCEFFGEYAAVSMNGCEYVYEIENAGPPYVGSVDIACAAGKKIEISTTACSVKIPAQSAGGSVGYREADAGEGESAVGFDVAATGLSYEANGPLCFLIGSQGGAFGGALLLS